MSSLPSNQTFALLGTLALIAVGTISPAASGISSEFELTDVVKVLETGLNAVVEAPGAVAAGSSFKSMVTVRLAEIGATVVEVVPIDVPDQCAITSYEVMAGQDLGNNQYLITNTIDLGTGLEEVQMKTLPTFLRIGLGFSAQQNVAGICNPQVDVFEVLSPLTAPIHLSSIVDVQLPAVPLAMGHIKTVGGADIADGAQVVAPATPVLVYTVVTPNPLLTLHGFASHSDGYDWGDYGRFWFSGGGGGGPMAIADPTNLQAFSVTAAVPYEPGTTVDTEYCFHGVYVDGGWWDDEEGPAATCSLVSAVAPDIEAVEADVCALFWSLASQSQFVIAETAYVLPVSGPFAGTAVNIGHTFWHQTCQQFNPVIDSG